jgi:hypothetical protein
MDALTSNRDLPRNSSIRSYFTRAASAFAFLCDKVDPSIEVLLDVLLLDFDFNSENTVLLFLLNDFSFVSGLASLVSSVDTKAEKEVNAVEAEIKVLQEENVGSESDEHSEAAESVVRERIVQYVTEQNRQFVEGKDTYYVVGLEYHNGHKNDRSHCFGKAL